MEVFELVYHRRCFHQYVQQHAVDLKCNKTTSVYYIIHVYPLKKYC